MQLKPNSAAAVVRKLFNVSDDFTEGWWIDAVHGYDEAGQNLYSGFYWRFPIALLLRPDQHVPGGVDWRRTSNRRLGYRLVSG